MKQELVVQKNPKSPIAEVFRTLRTNLQFMNSQKSLKTILVTSTMPGAGKTWVSSNLAITFAQTGKRVVIIDADMRKGRLYDLFKIENVPGLSNYLSGINASGKLGRGEITGYIRRTEIDNLFVVPYGNVPPNPSELLASEITENMLEKLKELFDIIILDGTPSLLVTDAVILSRMVDTTLIVAAYNNTKKEDLQKIKKSIENVGGKIAGVVLNKTPLNNAKYESTYYYNSTSLQTIKLNTSQYKRNDFDIQINEEQDYITQEKEDEIMDQLNDFLRYKKS